MSIFYNVDANSQEEHNLTDAQHYSGTLVLVGRAHLRHTSGESQPLDARRPRSWRDASEAVAQTELIQNSC